MTVGLFLQMQLTAKLINQMYCTICWIQILKQNYFLQQIQQKLITCNVSSFH